MKPLRIPLKWAMAPAAIAVAGIHPALAEVKDWNPPSNSSDWALGANWGGTAPADDLLTDTARFNLISYTNKQPNAGTRGVGGIEIGDGTTATGVLTISGVDLALGAGGIVKQANSGGAAVSAPVTLGAAQTWTNLSASSLAVSGGVESAGFNLTIDGPGDTAINAVLSGSGSLTMAGTGSLTLDPGNLPNTFSGGVTVQSGTLNANGSNVAFGSGANAIFGTGLVTLGAASGSQSAAIVLGGVKGNPTAIVNPIEVAAGSGGTLSIRTASGATSVVLSGSVALHHDLTLGVGGNQSLTFSNSISGTGDITIDNAGSGSVAFVSFSGNNSGFTGNLRVVNGAFYSGNAANVLSTNNAIFVGANGFFGMGNGDLSIAGLGDVDGAGGVVDRTNTAGSGRTLTLSGTGAYSFSGVVSDNNTGAGALGLKINFSTGGSQTLSGVNSYRGLTTITAGILTIQNGSALGSTDAGTTISSGATLRLQGGIAVGAEPLTIAGAGAVGQNGSLVNVSGTNSYAGALTMANIPSGNVISSDSGRLNLTNPGAIGNANGRAVILTGAGDGSLAGSMSLGAITKSGAGKWVLTGASTYAGNTTVSAGTLIVNGSLTSVVSVSAGTFGGSGSTTEKVTIGDGAGTQDAFLSPGDDGIGTFSAGGLLTLAADSVFKVELNSDQATVDKVTANGVSIKSNALFSFTDLGNGGGLSLNQVFTLIGSTGTAISGTFVNLANHAIFSENGISYQASYSGGPSGLDLTLTVVAVPEPSAYAMIGMGLLAGALFRRRRPLV